MLGQHATGESKTPLIIKKQDILVQYDSGSDQESEWNVPDEFGNTEV